MTSAPTDFEQARQAQALSATRPTRLTRFLRTFLPWQAFRFLVINLKMIRIIRKGHP